MLLYCPQCNTGYEIEPDLIPEKGIKMRCAKCGKIWRCTREDLQEEQVKTIAEPKETQSPQPEEETQKTEDNPTPESESVEQTPANTEMQDIFARLSTQTQDLFQQEQARPFHEKLWIKLKHSMGLDRPGTLKYYLLLIVAIIALCLFAVRYEVVRVFPQAEKIYSALGAESRVVGEGLEFQNIIRNEYEEDYVRKLEIKGYIVNTTPQKIEMPLIHVEIMDKDTNLLQAVDDKAPIAELSAGEKQMFRIVVTQPSALAKYVLLTFSAQKD